MNKNNSLNQEKLTEPAKETLIEDNEIDTRRHYPKCRKCEDLGKNLEWCKQCIIPGCLWTM